MIWNTILSLLGVAAAAAFSENLVFSRAFGLGELEYDEFTPRQILRESWLVTLTILLASVSGWGGRRLVDRFFQLPAHLRAPVFLGIYTLAFLIIMGAVILVRKKQGKSGCDCGCSSCSGCAGCSSRKPAAKKGEQTTQHTQQSP